MSGIKKKKKTLKAWVTARSDPPPTSDDHRELFLCAALRSSLFLPSRESQASLLTQSPCTLAYINCGLLAVRWGWGWSWGWTLTWTID